MQCFFCSAQTVPAITEEVNRTINRVYADYFYTHPDSAILLFTTAARKAEAAQRRDLQITLLLQAAWCADYHTRIDTLQHYLGLTEQLLRDHSEALDTLDPAGTLATDVAYTRGAFYYTSGDFASAVDAFSEIVQPRSLTHISDSLLVADVFAYLGSAYYRLQNYRKASDHYRIADQWLPRHADVQDYERSYRKALNALYRAQSYYASAKYDQQPRAYEQGKAVAHQALAYLLPRKSNPRFRNPIRSGANVLASIFQEQQQYDSALYYLELVLPLQGEQNTVLINTYNRLGTTYALMQRYPEAMAYYRQSMQLAERLLPSRHYLRAMIHTLSGKVYADQGRWPEALAEYQLGLSQLITEFNPTADVLENPPYQDSGAKKELLEVLAYKAEALWGLYQQEPADPKPLRSALEIYHQIGDMLDHMRKVFPAIEYKQFIASRFFSIHEQAIRTAYELHQQHSDDAGNPYLSEAFYFAERSKSTLLLEATREAQAKNFAGIPPGLLEQEREYTRKRSLLERQLSEAADPASDEATAIRQQLLATQDAYQDLLRRLEQEYPKYYALKHDTHVTSLTDVQTALPEGTVLLSYFYGDSSLFAFGISPEKTFLHPVPVRDSIQSKVARLIRYTSQFRLEAANDIRTTEEFALDSYTTYRQLVGIPLDSLGSTPQKLIIIPDGALGYLPFEVLLTDSARMETVPRLASLPYLLKQYPLRYDYSATLYRNHTIPKLPQDTQYAYTGFAPIYKGTPSLLAEDLTRSPDEDVSFRQLLYNKEEVTGASRLFESKVFLDEAATETAFREYAAKSEILHLSMHAFAHDKEPLYSGLVFSQPAAAEEDNFLYAYELYNMQLQARLAVLSACETGVGQLARGEGIMSLGRAFTYAGCPNVAMSLWKVNDQTTQRIVQTFFEQLADGREKDEALRQAKLSFLEEAKGPLAHPYYWASLVLIGDDQPVKENAFSPLWLPGIALGLGIVLVGFLLARRNQKMPEA